MLAITQVSYIRKLYFDKGKSFTEIEKATGHNYRKKKHRHTAKAIYKRALREEPELCQVAERTMRSIVKQERLRLYEDAPCFLDLNHPGGEAQVDFGEIYVIKNGVRKLMHELVLSFPASNVGYCQVTRSETMEALMESLVAIFEYTGLVPNKIWFDQMASAHIIMRTLVKTRKSIFLVMNSFREFFNFLNVFRIHQIKAFLSVGSEKPFYCNLSFAFSIHADSCRSKAFNKFNVLI